MVEVIDKKNLEPIVKDYRYPNNSQFTHTFQSLQDSGFHMSDLRSDDICPVGIWPDRRGPALVSPMQLNFIDDGLLLTWAIHHTVSDAQTLNHLCRLLAQECRRGQGLDVPSPPFIMGNRPDTSALKQFGQPTIGPPDIVFKETRGGIFSFTRKSLQMLKMDCFRPGKSESEVDYISTNDAMLALIWTSIMKERFADNLDDESISTLGFALNGRKRSSAGLSQDCTGCFLVVAQVSLPVQTLLGLGNLQAAAGKIRRAVNEANYSFDGCLTDEIMAVASQLRDFSMVAPTILLGLDKSSVFVTSWADMDVYSLDWGAALGGTTKALRVVGDGILHGAHAITESLPHGGKEIFLAVEDTCLRKLMTNAIFMKYADTKLRRFN
ncbi:unnamed protein product [Fusarium fujikuroi]|nr:unnamed protein product [Fusarium fujikuroi]